MLDLLKVIHTHTTKLTLIKLLSSDSVMTPDLGLVALCLLSTNLVSATLIVLFWIDR